LDGKYDEAIEIYKNILQKAKEDENYSDKKYDLTKENLASAYLQTHRCQEADEILKELPRNKGDLAYEYAVCDQKAKARALIPELEDPFDRAGVYAALGEAEEAFKALDDAYEKRSFHLFQLAVDPAFEPLKSDPRFKDQLRRIKYPM
jgi:tetratricopeptide (TPR) repeat protein